jgi:8-oxo-dGTP pyrophosphatase MutT (NUDIX family)
VSPHPHTESKYIEAAGGYVARRTSDGIELLMIFRRGVWDLPKGKIDAGETPAECGVREVAEETGATDLMIERGLGMTLHSYEERGVTVFKSTWWFLMTTGSTVFTPELEEQIERVEWIPWDQARDLVGYDNLRRHMASVENAVHGGDDEVA